MLTPELSVTQVDDKNLKYIVKFVENRPVAKKTSGEIEVIEQLVSLKEHEQMMYDLRMRSLQDFAERFGEVCSYFIAKQQYVEFEEIGDVGQEKVKG